MGEKLLKLFIEASRGVGAQSVGSIPTRRNEIFIQMYMYFHFPAQHAMPPEFSGKWGVS